MFLDLIPSALLVGTGLLGSFLFMWYVWRSGDWSFASSDLALVECDEDDWDFTEAPEREGWARALLALGLLGCLMLVAVMLGL